MKNAFASVLSRNADFFFSRKRAVPANYAITIPLANKAPHSGAKANAAVGGAGASIAFV